MTEERVKQLKETLDLARQLVTMDIYYCVYDDACVVQYMYPEDGDKDGIYVGQVFHDPTGKLKEVIQTGEGVHNLVPLEKHGMVMEGNVVPVFEDGRICGAVSSAYFPMNQQQLESWALAIQSIYYLILFVDGKTTHCNKVFYGTNSRCFPMDAQHYDDFFEKSLKYIYPDDREDFKRFTDFSYMSGLLQQKRFITMECRIKNGSDGYRWMELGFKRVENYEGSGVYENYLYMMRDIHEGKSKELEAHRVNQELIEKLKETNDALFEQSIRDEMTGMYNRKGLVHFSEKTLQTAMEDNLNVYTLVLDLNGLKYINDKFGHEHGDRAIQIMAKLLKQAAPESAIVIRSGGDEFLMLAALKADSGIPEEIERQFLENVRLLNSKGEFPYKIEASYGWNFCPADTVENIDACIRQADEKMYQMKRHRKVPGNFSEAAQKEISRRFGSAKQDVLILSPDSSVQKEVASMFDHAYQIWAAETVEEAMRKLEEIKEVTLLFIDNHLPGTTGMSFLSEMPENLRQQCIMILLMEEEVAGLATQAFALGVDDVLVRPYATEINKCHMTHLFRMNVVNRKLSLILEN